MARVRRGQLLTAQMPAGPVPAHLAWLSMLWAVDVIHEHGDCAIPPPVLNAAAVNPQAAAEYIAQHPPAGGDEAAAQADKAAKPAARPAGEDVRWKWDMLRPVASDDAE